MTVKFNWAVVLLLLAGLCSSVYAQDSNSTPQPEQGFIIRWSQDIIYPAGIKFEVTAGLPLAQQASALLVIQPESRAAITIPIDLTQAAVVGGDNPQFEYFWSIPASNPPLLFRNIEFRWQFSSTDNQTSRIDDKFTFIDSRVNWMRDLEVGDNIRLTLPNTVPNNATPIYSKTGVAQFIDDLGKVAELLAVNVGTIPDFNFLIYSGDLKPECDTNSQAESVSVDPSINKEVACDPAAAAAILKDSGYLLLQSPTIGLERIQGVVVQAVIGQSYAAQWTGKDVPKWFQYGLGLFYSPSMKSELGVPLASAARTNSLMQLDIMLTAPGEEKNSDLWRAQSYGMVLYIASQIGTDGLFQLAKDIGRSASFDSAYQGAMNKPLDSLVGDFGRWLFTDAASSSFSFTPYDAATLTPTSSRTPTATLTLTATLTRTLTPTPTVTGVLSLTPIPTMTVTHTPTAAPATHTPRPAGSLNTATPVPEVQLSPASQNTLVIGVLLFLGGLVLVGIIALVLTRPRR